MSKYNNYGQFMIAVLDEAEKKGLQHGISDLIKLFGLSDSSSAVISIIYKILEVGGWRAFAATCALLVLGPIAFAAALGAFVLGGIGAIVVAALAIYGGIKAIRLLYTYKATPLAILEVGKRYKSRFDDHKDEITYIDQLIDEASDDLIKAYINNQ